MKIKQKNGKHEVGHKKLSQRQLRDVIGGARRKKTTKKKATRKASSTTTL